MGDQGTRVDPDKCLECGQDIKGQITPICLGCLHKREARIKREREREAWAIREPKDLALSADSKKVGCKFHLVMAVDATWTYCGQRPTQPKKQRRRVPPRDLPDRMCPDCLRVLEHIQKTAASPAA